MKVFQALSRDEMKKIKGGYTCTANITNDDGSPGYSVEGGGCNASLEECNQRLQNFCATQVGEGSQCGGGCY